MAVQLFNKTSFSATYQKGMIPAANEIVQLILSYVEKKTNGRALEMAVDVGCGTGRYTIPLASHFKKVLGTDISVSQINVAKEDSTPKNVFYLVAPAEKLPLRDASVDLVTAGLAAHWFNFDKFASEAIRVLKTNGCLAVHAYHPDMDIEYNDLSHELNVVLSEVWDTLYQYDDEKVTENMLSQYQQIFQAVLLKDKEWITNVPVTIQMSVSDLMWYIRSIYMSEAFMEKNIIKAEEFFIKTEKKKESYIMAAQLFSKTSFSSVYRTGMIPASNEIVQLILSHVQKKTNGRPLEMALDVGCGTGRYTIPLAPHFKKVLGIDISESQINLAKQYNSAGNVSYMVAPAEKMPLKDASVDLVTSGLAAHWFSLDKFAGEAVRVLRTKGCFAVHAFHPDIDIQHEELSHELKVLKSEVLNTLYQHDDKKITECLNNQYREIFEALPLKDKEWITNVPVTIQMSALDLMGFIRSVYMYEAFAEKDTLKAEEFFTKIKKRLSHIMGENINSAVLNVLVKYYCVLACKD